MAAILHLVPSWEDQSIQRIALHIMTLLEPRGYQWHIGVLSSAGTLREEFVRVGAHAVDFSDGGTKTSKTVYRDLLRYAEEHQIDIVHTHTPRTAIVTAIALKTRQRPVHVSTAHLMAYPGDRRFGWVYTLANRATLYLPAQLMPVSETMAKQIRGYPLVRQSRITPIQNGIEHERFYAPQERDAVRAEFGFAPEHIVMGYTGRIALVKRIDLLLRAFAALQPRYPNARILLAGKGEYESELRTLAEELGISQYVTWAGFRRDVPRILAALDIYVQSSVNEGLSLSVLEAMAANKAVVASEVGGIHEIMESGINGMIVPPADQTALTQALERVLSDASLREALGNAARAFVGEHFSIQRMVNSYDAVYQKWLGQLGVLPVPVVSGQG